VHGDLCAENMLRDVEGRLRVVDNERLRPGSPAHDCERTRYRWPLPPAARAAFLAAYSRHRDPAPDAAETPFWGLRTLVQSAHVRGLRWEGDAGAPLAALEALLSGAPGADAAGLGAWVRLRPAAASATQRLRAGAAAAARAPALRRRGATSPGRAADRS
jgi:hypothetical protein